MHCPDHTHPSRQLLLCHEDYPPTLPPIITHQNNQRTHQYPDPTPHHYHPPINTSIISNPSPQTFPTSTLRLKTNPYTTPHPHRTNIELHPSSTMTPSMTINHPQHRPSRCPAPLHPPDESGVRSPPLIRAPLTSWQILT